MLCGYRQTVVMGRGNLSARLMLVGEGPGRNEDEQGQPFVGQAGTLLEEIAAKLGIDLAAVYITNIVACRPPSNRVPTEQERVACRPRLDSLVWLLRPAVLVLLGGTALESLTGERGITSHRGEWIDTLWRWKQEAWTIPAMPTYHPAGLLPGRLKAASDLDTFAADIKAAWDRAHAA